MNDPLAHLRARFRVRCQEDLSKIVACGIGSDNRTALAEVCHKLAGVAGGFGAKDLSRAASDIELKILAGQWPDNAALERVQTLLRTYAGADT